MYELLQEQPTLQCVCDALKAVQQNGLALKDLDDKLKNNLCVVHAAIRQNGLALQYSRELQNDKRTVLEAVEHDGSALQFASDRLKDDEEVVSEAVQQNGTDGHALQYASERLRNNLYLVAHAIITDPTAIWYASPRLKNHSPLVKVVIATENPGETGILNIISKDSELLWDETVVGPAIFQNHKLGIKYQHWPWAKRIHMYALLCQLGKQQWQKEGWDATQYFAQYYEILRQFVGVLEETKKSMLSDTPQQESDENAQKAERLSNVAQEEKEEWERKQEEDGEKFWGELLDEREAKRQRVR